MDTISVIKAPHDNIHLNKNHLNHRYKSEN